MRLIDADALKEILCISDLKEMNITVSGVILERLIDCVPTVGGWISVEDRLPEEHKLVLAMDEIFSVHVNWIIEGKWARPFHNRITYWMAIPNLPKEVDDDDT